MNNQENQICFESERLKFRHWKDTDYDFFIQLNRNAQVREFFGGLLTAKESLDFLKRNELGFQAHGLGYWCVEEMDSKKHIGALGFSFANFQAPFTPCLEIGWRFHPEAWKKGYATEGGKAALHYLFSNTSHKEVYAFTSPLNMRSEAVMIRIGMKKCGYFHHPNVPSNHILENHVYYKIEKNENV